MSIRILKFASLIIQLRSILQYACGRKIEILTARPYELRQICEPPLTAMNTKNLIPFNSSIIIDLDNVGRFVCLRNNSDIDLFVRLIAIEKELQLSIGNSTMIHLQPISIVCSITLWQSRDTLENIIIIRHGVSLVAKKEYFRHENRLDIILETDYKPSSYDGDTFSCVWAVKETWGSNVVAKDMEKVEQKRNIIIPVSNVRPSAIEAKLGQPIHCLYDGSESDQTSWYPISSPAPRHVIGGRHKDVLRILEVGRFEFSCEVNSSEEYRGVWSGEINILSRDFNDSSLPLSYLFSKNGESALLKSRYCNSELDIYWINQSEEVSKVIDVVDESNAGMYGCLIGSEIMALLRLVVIKHELNLSTPLRSHFELDVIDLTCSVSAIFKYGQVTNHLELFLSDGTALAKNSKSVDEGDDLDLKLRYVVRAMLEDSGKVYVCRWTVGEFLRGQDEYNEKMMVEYSYRVEELSSSSSSQSPQPASLPKSSPTSSSLSTPSSTTTTSPRPIPHPIKTSNIRPNTTITYRGSIIHCSNLNRPKDWCQWTFVGNTAAPIFTGLGPYLAVHSEGNFSFQCDCVNGGRALGGSFKPWIGVIHVLPKSHLIKGIDKKRARLKFISSSVADLTTNYIVVLFSLLIIKYSF